MVYLNSVTRIDLSRNSDYKGDGMKDLSVEDLLLIISEQEVNRKYAEDAFRELYWRFAEKLENGVRAHLKSRNIQDMDMVNAVVSNVFKDVFLDPLKFSYDPEQDKSEETKFRAWLYKIARNESADLIRASIQHKKLNVVGIEDNIVEQYAYIEIEEEVLQGNRKLLEQALATLSERDRHILLTCFDYYEEGRNTPSNVLDELCEYWGTTRENIRQRKKRSLDKVKKEMERLTQLKLTK